MLSLALSLVLAQAAPDPAAAATAQPAATALTLDEALRLAAARNLDLKASAARLRQAEQATWKARSYYLPQVTASGAYTRNEAGAAIPAGTLGEGSPEITIVERDQLAGQIDGSQMLFSPALWFGMQAASSGADAQALLIEDARRDILFGTASAFYAVASTHQTVAIAERLLEINLRQEKDARVRFQAGTIAKVALLRAEIDRARAEQDLRRARNTYESTRIVLAYLLDRSVDFEVAEPPEPKIVPQPSQLETDALRDRPDVRAARRSRDSAHAAYRAQIGKYFPNVAAFGRWQIQNAAGFTGKEHQWAAGVGLAWPILDGGLREAELREASARVDEGHAVVARAESRARAEVKQALLDLESARANAEKAKEQRDLAAENQRLIDVSYKAGAATAVEQADATAELRTAEITVQVETLSARLAALRVLRVAGVELR